MYEWMRDYELLCFDFDGLLVNTEDLHYEAYKDMLKKYGYHLPWSFHSYCIEAHVSTETLRNAIYGLFPDLEKIEPNWEVLRHDKQSIYLKLIAQNHIKLMPGIKTFLEFLRSHKKNVCVVTNSTREQIEQIMAVLPELKVITHWITREDYDKPKPKPDCYLKALKTFDCNPSKTLGFEDTMKGVNALLSAHIQPILIRPHSYPPIAVESNILQYRSFEELENLKEVSLQTS